MSNLQNNEQHPQGGQTIIINQTGNKNGIGTAGFVLALLGLIFCWVPVLDWILWILGLILSAIGVFKEPKGLAIAGLCISLVAVILIVFIVGALLSLA
ncbi:MAG: hypothetical protein LBB31_00805 [Prevotellaceae bacterium]|jgi:hypothetical protein|nr:hypothetical protein [Prevotellaceae bacterium]